MPLQDILRRRCCSGIRGILTTPKVTHPLVLKSPTKNTEGEPTEEKNGELEVSEQEVEINDDLELVLPSGSKVGHRAMRQYYKQHLPTQEQRKSALITRLMSQYRALGWKNESGILQQRRSIAWTMH